MYRMYKKSEYVFLIAVILNWKIGNINDSFFCIYQLLFSDDVKCSSGTAANCAACGASCAGNDCKWDSGTSTCVVLGKSIDTCIYIY